MSDHEFLRIFKSCDDVVDEAHLFNGAERAGAQALTAADACIVANFVNGA